MILQSLSSDVATSVDLAFQTTMHRRLEHPLYEPWSRALESTTILLTTKQQNITIAPQHFLAREYYKNNFSESWSMLVGTSKVEDDSDDDPFASSKLAYLPKSLFATPEKLVSHASAISSSPPPPGTFPEPEHPSTYLHDSPPSIAPSSSTSASPRDFSNLSAELDQLSPQHASTPAPSASRHSLPARKKQLLFPSNNATPTIEYVDAAYAQMGREYVIPDFLVFLTRVLHILPQKYPIVIVEIKPLGISMIRIKGSEEVDVVILKAFEHAFAEMKTQTDNQARLAFAEYEPDQLDKVFILSIVVDRFNLCLARRSPDGHYARQHILRSNVGLPLVDREDPEDVQFSKEWKQVWENVSVEFDLNLAFQHL